MDIEPEPIEIPSAEPTRIDKVKALMEDATQDEVVEFMLYFKTFLQTTLKNGLKGLRK